MTAVTDGRAVVLLDHRMCQFIPCNPFAFDLLVELGAAKYEAEGRLRALEVVPIGDVKPRQPGHQHDALWVRALMEDGFEKLALVLPPAFGEQAYHDRVDWTHRSGTWRIIFGPVPKVAPAPAPEPAP